MRFPGSTGFYSDREHAPALVETYVEQQTTGPDGTRLTKLVRDRVFKTPDEAESATEIEAKLNLTDGVTVRLATKKVPNS